MRTFSLVRTFERLRDFALRTFAGVGGSPPVPSLDLLLSDTWIVPDGGTTSLAVDDGRMRLVVDAGSTSLVCDDGRTRLIPD